MYLLTFRTDTDDYKTTVEDRAEIKAYSDLVGQADATIVLRNGRGPETHIPASRVRDMKVTAY